jgi:hypothetical protein
LNWKWKKTGPRGVEIVGMGKTAEREPQCLGSVERGGDQWKIMGSIARRSAEDIVISTRAWRYVKIDGDQLNIMEVGKELWGTVAQGRESIRERDREKESLKETDRDLWRVVEIRK